MVPSQCRGHHTFGLPSHWTHPNPPQPWPSIHTEPLQETSSPQPHEWVIVQVPSGKKDLESVHSGVDRLSSKVRGFSCPTAGSEITVSSGCSSPARLSENASATHNARIEMVDAFLIVLPPVWLSTSMVSSSSPLSFPRAPLSAKRGWVSFIDAPCNLRAKPPGLVRALSPAEGAERPPTWVSAYPPAGSR